MTDATRKKIVYGVSVVAVLWAVTNIPDKDSKSVQTDIQPSLEQPITGSAVTHVPEKLVDIKRYENLEWGSDPFRTPVKTEAKQVEQVRNWVLSGIVFNPDQPMAIINNTTVGIGDMVDQAKVIAIERKRVTLNYRGSQITLMVAKG
ncbi:MAG: general secretion pathway protein GspB [candidate division Zixibacteria bacterium]|nr:general secretion pathway protein GspB [candidate division Zixibacteria bacterium]